MIFQYTRQMLHYVASSDYKAGELYDSKNPTDFVYITDEGDLHTNHYNHQI